MQIHRAYKCGCTSWSAEDPVGARGAAPNGGMGHRVEIQAALVPELPLYLGPAGGQIPHRVYQREGERLRNRHPAPHRFPWREQECQSLWGPEYPLPRLATTARNACTSTHCTGSITYTLYTLYRHHHGTRYALYRHRTCCTGTITHISEKRTCLYARTHA